MSKKSIGASIIFGIVIGSAGTYFTLENFPFLQDSSFAPSIGSFNEISEKKVEEAKQQNVLLTNDLKYQILDVKKSDFGVNGEVPLEGGVFVITKIQIENIGKTESILYGDNWFVKDSEGRIYKVSSHNAQYDEEKKFQIRIPPGFKVVKDIGFEVPENSNLSMGLFVADSSFESEPIFLGQIL